MTADRDVVGLRADLLEVIARGAAASIPADHFERLALRIFAWQFEQNPLYRGFCEARGATPVTVRGSLEIPAVPTDAFKAAPLVCGDPSAAAVLFRTSGTTAGAEHRGEHFLLHTDLYQAALRAGFRHHLLPDRQRMRLVSLIPPPSAAPDSSLSFMIGDLATEIGRDESRFFASGEGLRMEELLEAMRDAASSGEPLLVVGTSLAFVHYLEWLAARDAQVLLPTGSRLMDTGGFKGWVREIERSELYEMIERRLGVPASHIVNEFGMTEMSTQLYDGVAGSAPAVGEPRLHRGPGWLRTTAVDPETLRPLDDGELGILRHLDLANLYSVAALQTADVGRVTRAGVEMLGRAPRAEARGCSIAMDELLEVMRSGG